MGYVYAGMWLLAGLILIFRMSKENRVFFLVGGFFILLGGWWFADALLPIDLFAGTWGIILRVITGLALAVCCIVFFRDYRKTASQGENKEQQAPTQTETVHKSGGENP